MSAYYVDTAGNDGNSGLTELLPWLTVNKVNISSFNAGDSVSFNKTCTWREQLTVPSSGSAGNPITFGAYGTGADPKILGSLNKDSAGDWTQEAGSVSQFSSGLETNDFSEWTTVSNVHGNFAVSTDKAHGGTHSCKVVQVSGDDGSLAKTGLGDVSNATFSVWVNFISTTDPDASFRLNLANNDGAANFNLRYSGGAFKTTATVYNDAGTGSSTSAYTITANTGE